MNEQNPDPVKYGEEAGIYLRLMTEDDTDRIISWRNNPSVRKYFIDQNPFTVAGHRKWIDTMVKTGKVVQMIICLSAGDKPVGSVYLRDIDMGNRKAEYGIFIGEDDSRGKGIGTTAAKLMLAYGFETLGLHRIFLRVFSDNERAIASYEHAGFVREALLHDDVYVDGRYRDIVLMGALNNAAER